MNNAGRSMRGKVLDTTPEQFRDLLELNLIALVRCTRAAAPHLLAQRGHVVNIGSLAAKSAARWVGALSGHEVRRGRLFATIAAGVGAAGAARAAGLSRTDRAQAIRGSIRWPGWKTFPSVLAGPAAGVKARAIPPQQLARAILRACERRRPELVMPGSARLLFALAQLFPRLGDWIVLRKT